MNRPSRRAAAASLAMLLLGLTGCATKYGPNFGPLYYPVPVSPFFQQRLEDKFWNHKRYDRVPIMGPITEGGPPKALDPPSPDEVIRALEKARPINGGVPFLHEVQRNNVQMTIELIDEYIDPPRVMPLVGPVQQHHAHYKCTLYFTEIKRTEYPIPHTLRDEEAVEVVYIDHNHLHIVGNVDGGLTSNY